MQSLFEVPKYLILLSQFVIRYAILLYPQNNNQMPSLSKNIVGCHRDSAILCFVGCKHKIGARNDHEYLKTIPILQILNCIVDCNVVDAQNDLI